MGCPHCTPYKYEDGEVTDFYQGYYYTDEELPNHKVRVRLEPWVDDDDGSMWWTVLMSDEWLSNYMHELGEKSKLAGTIVASIPAPPYCPWCGRRLGVAPDGNNGD